jgi:hypothetical protein
VEFVRTGRPVRITRRGFDRYQRALAVVIIGGEDVAALLNREGLAPLLPAAPKPGETGTVLLIRSFAFAALVACLGLGAWTFWRAETTFVAFLVLAAAFGGAALGAGCWRPARGLTPWPSLPST